MTILGMGRAPAKVILFGEHAVVYGRPALAVPVTQVQAEATVEAGVPGSGLVIWAADLDEEIALRTAPADHPLAAAVRLALAEMGARDQGSRIKGQETGGSQLPASSFQTVSEPDWRISVHSTIPIASGLGSGAAVSAAIVRALAEAAGRSQESGVRGQQEDTARQLPASSFQLPLSPAEVSALVYEVEKLYHGTPSGIDNTVIAYGQPVYFVAGQPPQPFPIGRPFTLVIADSGIASPTKIAVGDVRQAWERDRVRFEALFDRIAAVVEAARAAIAVGEPEKLGLLMDANHVLLQEIEVSCLELDALAATARAAGALGAKLSGGGRGGNLIALVTDEIAPQVADALRGAGAVGVIVTSVGMTGGGTIFLQGRVR